MATNPPFPDSVPTRSGRFALRPWVEADAERISAAIASSIEHLRPWMAWIAEEPMALAQRRELIRKWRLAHERGEETVYGIVELDPSGSEGDAIGGSGLHRRDGDRPGRVEIGYWIAADHVGRGIATEVAAALTDAAFATPGVEEVAISHAPSNVRSARVPEKLGFIPLDDRGAVCPGDDEPGITWVVDRPTWESR